MQLELVNRVRQDEPRRTGADASPEEVRVEQANRVACAPIGVDQCVEPCVADAATVLLLPSFSEGLPRVAMEAFARGRPVIGARAGGIPDIVEDGVNGLLVDPQDPDSIADALVRVLSDRELAERLAVGAAASAEHWLQPPEVYANRLRELVEGLL